MTHTDSADNWRIDVDWSSAYRQFHDNSLRDEELCDWRAQMLRVRHGLMPYCPNYVYTLDQFRRRLNTLDVAYRLAVTQKRYTFAEAVCGEREKLDWKERDNQRLWQLLIRRVPALADDIAAAFNAWQATDATDKATWTGEDLLAMNAGRTHWLPQIAATEWLATCDKPALISYV